ncbi:MAG: peptidylprolyl isomerase [Pseudomonadota bacterium]
MLGYRAILVSAAAVLFGSFSLAYANPFAPAIEVNDQVVTEFEIEQRQLLLGFLGGTGNLRTLAEDVLIEDRLKLEASKRQDIEISQDELVSGMSNFAARGNLSLDEFISIIEAQGIYRETFEDFVRAGLAWQNLVTARFGFQGVLSDTEIDAASASGTVNRDAIELRIFEIVLPYASRGEAEAKQLADELRRDIVQGTGFEISAAQYSESSSANNGGDRGWVSVNGLSETIAGPLLASGVGTLSEPLEIGNAIAIINLRGIRTNPQAVEPTTIEYMTMDMPVDTDPSNILGDVDTCNDLRAASNEISENNYEVRSVLEGSLAQPYATAFQAMDVNETSVLANVNGAQELIMVCSRSRDLQEDARARLRNVLGSQRVESFGEAFLQELIGNASITRL